MDETIDLQDLFLILKKRSLLIIILAFLGMGIGGAITHYFMIPIYQTSTQLIVSRPNDETLITVSEISANIQLINTYNDILVSPAILNQVIDELNLATTSNVLRGKMTARNASNSQVITLTIQHESPTLARDIADKTAEIFSYDVRDIMNVDNVSILAPAQVPSSPVSPRLLVNLGIGFAGGITVAIFLAFLLMFLDKTVKTEQEVEKLLNIPVFGMIPLITQEDIKNK